MNTIKLTHNDLRTMINEAVNRTLSERWYGRSYSPSPKYYTRTLFPKPKYTPYPEGGLKWHDADELKPFDDEQMNASILEDIEDFKYVMGHIVEKTQKLMAWAAKNNVSINGFETAFKKHSGLNGRLDGGYLNNAQIANEYINAKVAETKQYPWDVVIEYGEMSPEEQDQEIQNVLVPVLAQGYHDQYGKYESEFGAASDKRNEVIAKVEEIVAKYGEADLNQLSYVDICEGIKTINRLGDEYGMSEAADKFFEEYDIVGIKKRLMEEWKVRKEAAPSFHLGWMNGWNEKDEARYEELKKIMAQGRDYNARGSSTSERMRGYNQWSGDIVDNDGNLLATYSYGVDSSD